MIQKKGKKKTSDEFTALNVKFIQQIHKLSTDRSNSYIEKKISFLPFTVYARYKLEKGKIF